MIDIIKVELFRLKKSVLFWVMLGLTIAIPLFGAISMLTVSGIADKASGQLGELLSQLGLTTQYLQGSAQLSSWPAILALITSAIVLSTEFTDGTVRNVLLANKSRAELYFAYLVISMIVAVTYFAAYFVIILIIIVPIFGFDGMSAGQAVSGCLCSFGLGIVALIFVETCMCMSLFAIRKQWAAILIPLLISIFAPALIAAFASLILAAMALKGQIASVDDLSLRWVPFANTLSYNPATLDAVTIGMSVLYTALFSAAFVVIGYFAFKKSDLK